MKHTQVVLGIGANLGRPLDTFRHLLQRLMLDHRIEVLATSSIYQSPALLPENAPLSWDRPYLNMAICIVTDLEPLALLSQVKALEVAFGRSQNAPVWSPRPLDIDILAWGDCVIDLPELSVPHKGLCQRAFALIPLLEVLPTWQHPLESIDLWAHAKTFSALTPIAQRLDTPELMAIVNASPESFSGDGVVAIEPLAHLKALLYAGATILDIGAESTHPSAQTVDIDTQWHRLKPWLEAAQALKQDAQLYFTPQISVDCYHPQIIAKALAYEIDIVNDVKGCDTSDMVSLLKNSNCRYVTMHNGSAENIAALESHGLEVLEQLLEQGLAPQQVIYDIGLGFGKNTHQAAGIIADLAELALPCQLLVGHSRKATVMPSVQHLEPAQRDLETAMLSGRMMDVVDMVRVHCPQSTARVWQAIRKAQNLSQKS